MNFNFNSTFQEYLFFEKFYRFGRFFFFFWKISHFIEIKKKKTANPKIFVTCPLFTCHFFTFRFFYNLFFQTSTRSLAGHFFSLRRLFSGMQGFSFTCHNFSWLLATFDIFFPGSFKFLGYFLGPSGSCRAQHAVHSQTRDDPDNEGKKNNFSFDFDRKLSRDLARDCRNFPNLSLATPLLQFRPFCVVSKNLTEKKISQPHDCPLTQDSKEGKKYINRK